MTEPARPPVSLAPNLVGQVHPPHDRLRLGRITAAHYPGQYVTGGEALFWVWVPTREGGTLSIDLAPGEKARIRVLRGQDQVRGQVDGAGHLSVDIPRGEHGRFEVRISPATVDVKARFVRTIWARDGNKPLIPWNFWYFPYKPDSRDTYKSRDVQRSAMKKWDLILDPEGNRKLATTFEDRYHISDKPEIAGWEGHCDAGAAASVYFERPTASPPFTADELMLLASEWAGNHTLVEKDDWKVEAEIRDDLRLNISQEGSQQPCGHLLRLLRPDEWTTDQQLIMSKALLRYGEAFPRHYAAHRSEINSQAATLLGSDAARNDVKAAYARAIASQLDFIERRLGIEGHPLVGEIGGTGGTAAGIWNHVLFFARTEYIERASAPGTSGDPRDIEIAVALAFNDDVTPLPWRQPVPASVRGGSVVPTPGDHVPRRFALRVRFDAAGARASIDADHLLASWPADTWIPRQLQVLKKPGLSVQRYNELIDDRILHHLRMRPRYR